MIVARFHFVDSDSCRILMLSWVIDNSPIAFVSRAHTSISSHFSPHIIASQTRQALTALFSFAQNDSLWPG